ncbi:hypothetical protein [Marinobacter sp.]|uniref:hypothetical protein n=1 Tax=Marinobacter sp. TaxID=50741 RepID=UPI0035633411
MTDATQPLFDDPWSRYEYAARCTLDVGDNWKIRSVSTAVHPMIEDRIMELEGNVDLEDDQKWAELDVSSSPTAWLPRGWILVVMYDEEDPKDVKAGFVNVSQYLRTLDEASNDN